MCIRDSSKLNLRDNLAGAKERQVYVLREMRAERFITRGEEKAALEAEITIITPPVSQIPVPGALPMLLSGLALAGLFLRRRKTA